MTANGVSSPVAFQASRFMQDLPSEADFISVMAKVYDLGFEVVIP